jgi:hypothetical protein
MKMNMNFEMDNDAFYERYEFERILKDVVEKYNQGFSEHAIMDVNGNKVGRWEIIDEVVG